MANKLNGAIIGCGRIGSEFDSVPVNKAAFSHAGAYCLHPKSRLVSAADLDQTKLMSFSKKWGIVRVYKDYREMLRSEKIDILSICTPASTHWQILRDACEFSVKAVYCEKPISDNVKDAEKMVKLCRDRDRKSVV